MIDTLRFRYQMWRLQRRRRKISRLYDKMIAEQTKKKNSTKDDLRRLEHEVMFELHWVDEGIDDLISRHLLGITERRFLPRPRFEEDLGDIWVKSDVTGQIYLSRQAVSEVRAMIRKDTKERQELMLPWLSLLIGLVGALTGLIAVICSAV
jgi:hypothetical protein